MKVLVIFFFLLFIFALVFNSLFLNVWFYKFLFWQLALPADKAVIQSVSQNVIYFIKGDSRFEEKLFQPEELIHLADIKNLVYLEATLFLVLTLIACIFFIFSAKRKQARLLLAFIQGGSKMGMMISVVGVILFPIIFAPMFYLFHIIFFKNEFWMLDFNTDVLINVFPPQFFLLFMIYFFIFCFFVFSVIYFCLGKFCLTFETIVSKVRQNFLLM